MSIDRTRHLQAPWAGATVETMSATGAQAFTISNHMTILDGVTTEATANRTINLTITSGLKKGAKILVKSKANASEDTIYGTSITSATVTGSAGKTYTHAFTYDGSVFLPDGAKQQID